MIEQFMFAVAIFIGIPIVVAVLVVRGILKRRRALARWRDCARRNGWSDGPGTALMSGVNQGLAWSLGVEGSDEDDIVWRASSLAAMRQPRLHEPGSPESRLREVAETVYRGLFTSVRERFPLSGFSFGFDAKEIVMTLPSRDLRCEDAEALVNFGLAVCRRLADEVRP